MNLNEQFHDVRTNYFPQWDRCGEWKIVFGTKEQLRFNTGYCDTVAKVVFLDAVMFGMMSAEGKRAFIIHEICHDVGAAFHNRRWAERMQRAAIKAERIGESEVAEILRSDIYSYFGNGLSLPYDSDGIFEYLKSLHRDHPDMSIDMLRRKLSRFVGYRISKIERDFGDEIREFVHSLGID